MKLLFWNIWKIDRKSYCSTYISWWLSCVHLFRNIFTIPWRISFKPNWISISQDSSHRSAISSNSQKMLTVKWNQSTHVPWYIDSDKITYGRLLYGNRCLWNFSLWASTTTMDNKTQISLAYIFNSYVQPILNVIINVSIFISQLGIWRRLSRLKFDTSVKFFMRCNIRSIMALMSRTTNVIHK